MLVNYEITRYLTSMLSQCFHTELMLRTNFTLYFAGATAYSSAYFGKGTGGIYLDNLGCTGREFRLIDCHHSPLGVHNCDHSADAGMRCQRKTMHGLLSH